ncbi:hypothetical protein H257_09015 [Aphanomyces astaci]|uniref:Uncharacterized protein n=1 Tax=Aphanomyces astaci TaxID=112090 RepID=W4GCY3_APHAT|nr:hypothetical protein H257_09015 [Aphanomyces astaci]ETV77121.1 hypothetical protein H257_09015 [Aphanomyces astaci]|eukprot:XP_009833427.1 hypothetical protein H257_09015 [Aphanomyces astaci]
MPLTAAPHKQVYQFLVVNVGLPVMIYYVGREFTLVLALSAIPPSIAALVEMLASQTVDPLLVPGSEEVEKEYQEQQRKQPERRRINKASRPPKKKRIDHDKEACSATECRILYTTLHTSSGKPHRITCMDIAFLVCWVKKQETYEDKLRANGNNECRVATECCGVPINSPQPSEGYMHLCVLYNQRRSGQPPSQKCRYIAGRWAFADILREQLDRTHALPAEKQLWFKAWP